ncbi:MAG: DUF3783 domain-containing protein [Tissierellia bacterium]|nr:DUF3783 domain-containing protein [Tissierellia bacterium]
MNEQARLLIYQIENEVKDQALRQEAQAQGIEVREIKPSEVHHKVGYLAGLEGYEPSQDSLDPAKIEESEMILFVNTPREVLGQVLAQLHSQNFIFPHKATLTKSSKDWTFNYLVGHIEAEHQVMTAYARMMKDVKRGLALIERERDPQVEEALMTIQALQEMGDMLSLDNLKAAHLDLLAALEKYDK